MSDPERGWTVFCAEEAANVLEAMRVAGHGDLYDEVVLFLRALAVEAGQAADADKPLPGLPMGDGRYNINVPLLPVLVSYSRYPGMREFRITDVVWLSD
ncbi:hypothetical protein ACFV0C_31520 [Streptomyces sp. NPDC059568]|uniref:hypothetical protein n=1 Tax=unclassified Streptomyces TaxID=2593676 RepID=UPI0036AE76DF